MPSGKGALRLWLFWPLGEIWAGGAASSPVPPPCPGARVSGCRSPGVWSPALGPHGTASPSVQLPLGRGGPSGGLVSPTLAPVPLMQRRWREYFSILVQTNSLHGLLSAECLKKKSFFPELIRTFLSKSLRCCAKRPCDGASALLEAVRLPSFLAVSWRLRQKISFIPN